MRACDPLNKIVYSKWYVPSMTLLVLGEMSQAAR